MRQKKKKAAKTALAEVEEGWRRGWWREQLVPATARHHGTEKPVHFLASPPSLCLVSLLNGAFLGVGRHGFLGLGSDITLPQEHSEPPWSLSIRKGKQWQWIATNNHLSFKGVFLCRPTIIWLEGKPAFGDHYAQLLIKCITVAFLILNSLEFLGWVHQEYEKKVCLWSFRIIHHSKRVLWALTAQNHFPLVLEILCLSGDLENHQFSSTDLDNMWEGGREMSHLKGAEGMAFQEWSLKTDYALSLTPCQGLDTKNIWDVMEPTNHCLPRVLLRPQEDSLLDFSSVFITYCKLLTVVICNVID